MIRTEFINRLKAMNFEYDNNADTFTNKDITIYAVMLPVYIQHKESDFKKFITYKSAIEYLEHDK